MADLRDVYYAPGVHVRLVSLGNLEGQGWDVRLCDGEMEPRNRDGDLFANVEKVNVSLVGLNVISPRTSSATCTMDGDDGELTHNELIERPSKVTMVATAKRTGSIRATLLTRLSRLVALAESGANGMVITDQPERICVHCMGTLPA